MAANCSREGNQFLAADGEATRREMPEDVVCGHCATRRLERRALENVRMLVTSRMKRFDADLAMHLLRFCDEGGVSGSVLRDEKPKAELCARKSCGHPQSMHDSAGCRGRDAVCPCLVFLSTDFNAAPTEGRRT